MTRKAGIYIDGRNFEIGALSTLGYDVTTDFSEMHHFDFVSFFRDIAGESDIYCQNYYRGIPKVPLFHEKVVKEVGTYANHIIKIGIVLFAGYFTRQRSEKGVDVRLALDMVRDARDNKVDIIYLFSNDTDLLEAIRDARGHGVIVYHCVFDACATAGYTPNNALGVNATKRLRLTRQLRAHFHR